MAKENSNVLRDEATTLIANQLKTITQKYGAASRYVHVGTAVSGGTFSGDKMVRRLLNLTGGYLESYHSVSMGNTAAATPYTYGTAASGSSLDTLLDTKLVILWGITRRKPSSGTATTSTRR